MCLGLWLPLSPPDTTASPSRLTPSSNPQINLDSCPSSEPGQPHEDPLSRHPNSRVWSSPLLPWTLFSAQLLPVPLKLGREGQHPSYTLGPPPSAFAIEGPLTRKPPEPQPPHPQNKDMRHWGGRVQLTRPGTGPPTSLAIFLVSRPLSSVSLPPKEVLQGPGMGREWHPVRQDGGFGDWSWRLLERKREGSCTESLLGRVTWTAHLRALLTCCPLGTSGRVEQSCPELRHPAAGGREQKEGVE